MGYPRQARPRPGVRCAHGVWCAQCTRRTGPCGRRACGWRVRRIGADARHRPCGCCVAFSRSPSADVKLVLGSLAFAHLARTRRPSAGRTGGAVGLSTDLAMTGAPLPGHLRLILTHGSAVSFLGPAREWQRARRRSTPHKSGHTSPVPTMGLATFPSDGPSLARVTARASGGGVRDAASVALGDGPARGEFVPRGIVGANRCAPQPRWRIMRATLVHALGARSMPSARYTPWVRHAIVSRVSSGLDRDDGIISLVDDILIDPRKTAEVL